MGLSYGQSGGGRPNGWLATHAGISPGIPRQIARISPPSCMNKIANLALKEGVEAFSLSPPSEYPKSNAGDLLVRAITSVAAIRQPAKGWGGDIDYRSNWKDRAVRQVLNSGYPIYEPSCSTYTNPFRA